MRICRFTSLSLPPRFGVIQDDAVQPLAAGETSEYFISSQADRAVLLSEATLLAPVTPSKIICVGRNYKDHAVELGNPMPPEPLLFLKAPSAIIGDGDRIVLPKESSDVQHEGELGVVMGRTAHNVADDEDALDYVFEIGRASCRGRVGMEVV